MTIKRLLQHPWLLVLSLLLNAVLLTVFIFTLQKSLYFYQQYRVFRPMAHGISAATTLAIQNDRSEKLMILYGDSRIQQWKTLPNLNNTLVVNAGVAGDTALEMSRRLQQDVLRLSPDLVLIQIGMNDLTLAATRGINDPDKVIVRMKSNINHVVEKLLEQNIEVVLTPVLPARPLSIGRRIFWRNELDSRVSDTNEFLKSLAEKHSLRWIDLLKPLHDENGDLRVGWYADALHLVEDKYSELNHVVTEALNNN